MEDGNEKDKKYTLYHKAYYRTHKEEIGLKQKMDIEEFKKYLLSLSDIEFLEEIGFKTPEEQLKLPKIFRDEEQ